jgi:ATP-dependent Clp protease protease subunit
MPGVSMSGLAQGRAARPRLVVWAARIGAGLAILLVGALLVLHGMTSWKMAAVLDGLQSPEDLISSWVDQHIEAGYEPAALDPGDPLLAQRRIVVTHAINERTAKEIVERLLYLDARDPEAPIDLYLSSPGGWTVSAFTIIDAVRLVRAPVNAWAVGGCYSACAMVLAAGTGRRVATRDAILMVHAGEPAPDGPRSFDRLDNERIVALWRRVAKLPEDWFPLEDGEEHYLTAKQALDYGLVDAVVPDRKGGTD